MINVVLADDHVVVRKGVREFLEEEPDIRVVGEAGDGAQAVALALQLRPDVVVLDIRMPGMSGVEATRQIRAALPEARVLAFSAFDDDPYIYGLLEAGARGYILKTAESGELVRAIRTVMAGQTALDPAIAQRLVARVTHATPVEPLTARELEVLRLVADGLTNKQIAAQLRISDRTVQNHLANTFAKLNVASRTEAVTAGLKLGLLSLESDQ